MATPMTKTDFDNAIEEINETAAKKILELERVDKVVQAAVLAEREACAKIAEQTYYKQIIHYPEGYYINPNKLGMIYKDAASDCAAAIRARGNNV